MSWDPLLRLDAPLSHAELSAARLDGHVVELGDAYLPADRIETTGLRASSLAPLLPRRGGAALAGLSAAWVHGAGDRAPARHELQRIGSRRIRVAPTPRLTLHDVPVGASDAVSIGDVPVVAADRTLLDLLRRADADGSALRWAVALAAVDVGLIDAVTDRLTGQRSVPGHRRARERLLIVARAITDQEDVTRYTS